MKTRSLQSLPDLPLVGSEGLAGLPNLPNLPFSEFGSQSNTDFESSKFTVFRIGTNQAHPMMQKNVDLHVIITNFAIYFTDVLLILQLNSFL